MTKVQNIRDFIVAAELDNPENNGPVVYAEAKGEDRIILRDDEENEYLVIVQQIYAPAPKEKEKDGSRT